MTRTPNRLYPTRAFVRGARVDHLPPPPAGSPAHLAAIRTEKNLERLRDQTFAALRRLHRGVEDLGNLDRDGFLPEGVERLAIRVDDAFDVLYAYQSALADLLAPPVTPPADDEHVDRLVDHRPDVLSEQEAAAGEEPLPPVPASSWPVGTARPMNVARLPRDT